MTPATAHVLSQDGLDVWSLQLVSNGPISSATAHRFLRDRLADKLGVPVSQIEFTRNPCPECAGPNGRPVLAAPEAPLEFSLSRRGKIALVALAPAPVGVDVELIADASAVREVIPLLHPCERAFLSRLPPAERANEFARVWVRKEAYLKGVGSGIGHGLDTVRVDDAAPSGWRLLDLAVPAGYVAAVAIR